MTDSEKELVRRLREHKEPNATWHVDRDCTEAADAIERLSERVASLLNELNVTNTLREIANNGLGEFEEEVRRLERERDEANLHVAALLESNRILTRERDEARAELERVMRGLVTVPLLQRAEAAEAEVKMLRTRVDSIDTEVYKHIAESERVRKAEAEASRLREALGDAVKWMNGCVVSGDYPAWHKKARAALEEANHD